LILSSLIGIKIGNRKLKVNIGEYDNVIVCCPIWMGKVIAPIRAFLKENETII
jgi:multimeric flavodoxin WrbA